MSKKVDIHGVPLDLGANIRGSNMGPSAIRIAGLHQAIQNLGFETREMGDLEVKHREQISEKDSEKKYLNVIAEACRDLAERTEKSIEDGALPISLGGDHAFAVGSISGVSSALKKENKSLGVIWIDAHADLNTPETSPSGNIHGMPLAALIGHGFEELTSIKYEGAKVKPENVALIGIRSIDDKEREMCRKSGIKYFSMREIDEKGMSKVMEEAIACATNGTEGIHVSFDLDGIEPLYAPGVSTPVTGGLSYREAHLALELIADSNKLLAMDLVELNPMTDVDHKTAQLSVELIQSALGKSII
jgi:arginase